MNTDKKVEETSQENLFKTLWPGMIQHTRLLLVDYDVCRYHSFDQLRWQLLMDASRDNNLDHFMSIRHDLRELLNCHIEWADQVRFARERIDQLNVYKLFSKPVLGGQLDSRAWYETKLQQMFEDKNAKITPTDVSERFGIVFNRSDITGYLMRYKNDPHRTAFDDQVTILPVNHVLNMDVVAAAVQQYRINAIMISSSEMALQLAGILIKHRYTAPITWIIGRYAYNYQRDAVTGKLIPRFNTEMGELEIAYKYEYGFFDPFSGLTYESYLEDITNKEEQNASGNVSSE